MINEKMLVVVMPAYNAVSTLEKTYQEIPFDIVASQNDKLFNNKDIEHR